MKVVERSSTLEHGGVAETKSEHWDPGANNEVEFQLKKSLIANLIGDHRECCRDSHNHVCIMYTVLELNIIEFKSQT